MKILKTFLLVIYASIANAQDITLDVRVVKYKDATDKVETLGDTDGGTVKFKFLNDVTTPANNKVEVL